MIPKIKKIIFQNKYDINTYVLFYEYNEEHKVVTIKCIKLNNMESFTIKNYLISKKIYIKDIMFAYYCIVKARDATEKVSIRREE